MGLPKIRFTKLKRYHFVDSEDLDVGNLEDVTLDKDSLVPHHLILGAGFFEELMEELGKREDIDEIAPLELISEIQGDHVIISRPIDELPRTDKNGKMPAKYNVLMFSSLYEFGLIDQEGDIDATLLDLELNGDDSKFIFNYPTLQGPLQMEGFGQRFEVAFKVGSISLTKDKIVLPSTHDQLLELTRTTIQPKMRGKSQVNWSTS
ncbi:MAG: hypothetical protein IH840_06295 [Candidatus Heimdallarchaeota archaeon]|nr:hypothetical protein [Candidatus Heimdallarchaeota archaeon]